MSPDYAKQVNVVCSHLSNFFVFAIHGGPQVYRSVLCYWDARQGILES